jgi:predicted alpha/beta-fold hydrolase
MHNLIIVQNARVDFIPAWFVPGPHAQTIWGRLVRKRRMVKLRREVLATPDGDELVLDHLDGPSSLHFVLLHGLEGSSQSVYMQGILNSIAKHGCSATAVNFRSCARDPKNVFRMLPNHRPRFYHSGETSDFDFVVRTLAARGLPLVAFGASLGGNALLKWLGENPGQTLVRAAATISVPYDLGAGARHMDATRSGRFYIARFLGTLKKKVREVARKYPEKALDLDRVMASRTFRDFDDSATAPLHGFADADDYYRQSSSINYLSAITTPALLISAEDDPFLPVEVLERVRANASPMLDVRVTKAGGHTGFVSGSAPWKCVYWAEELAVQWLIERGSRIAA